MKRYLYENHQVPLHKINVNQLRRRAARRAEQKLDGRAQNRRVVIKVLT